jgi:hypothetical protein
MASLFAGSASEENQPENSGQYCMCYLATLELLLAATSVLQRRHERKLATLNRARSMATRLTRHRTVHAIRDMAVKLHFKAVKPSF